VDHPEQGLIERVVGIELDQGICNLGSFLDSPSAQFGEHKSRPCDSCAGFAGEHLLELGKTLLAAT
jgi:hypothetical protein